MSINNVEHFYISAISFATICFLLIYLPKIISRLCIRSFIIVLSVSIVTCSLSVFAFLSITDKAHANERIMPIITIQKKIKPGITESLALHLAYPKRISPPQIKNNRLGFYLDGIWFNWADGKLLTDDTMDKASNFSEHLFFAYDQNPPPLLKASENNNKMMEEVYNGRKTNTQIRNNEFLDTLYNGKNERSISKNIKLVRFLGFQVRAHEFTIDKLENVDKEIKLFSQTNNEAKAFLKSLKTVSGFVWKTISKSSSRSYHSYGVAFDTLPKRAGNKQIYWAWTRVNNRSWYAVDYENRWSPPKSIVEIFEKNGFIWGGKWQFYDTIHFEYRPEILIYNRLINDRRLLERLVKKLNI